MFSSSLFLSPLMHALSSLSPFSNDSIKKIVLDVALQRKVQSKSFTKKLHQIYKYLILINKSAGG